jgi:Topoisomerase DNA binding C4 zinc finger
MAAEKDIEDIRQIINDICYDQSISSPMTLGPQLKNLSDLYNKVFPRFTPNQRFQFQSLISKFCPTDHAMCPMCSGPMMHRSSGPTRVSFLGCSKFPKCKGIRSIDGKIHLNRDLKEWLLEKQKQGNQNQRKVATNRLSGLMDD